jgi:hypothetical protein
MVAIDSDGENITFRTFRILVESMLEKLRRKKTWLFTTDMVRNAKVTFPEIEDFD